MAPRDPGLQSERTSLAWARTVMASFAVTIVLARIDALQAWRARGLPAALTLVVTVACWLGSRYRLRDASEPPGSGAPRLLLGAVALATTAAAVTAILLVLPPG